LNESELPEDIVLIGVEVAHDLCLFADFCEPCGRDLLAQAQQIFGLHVRHGDLCGEHRFDAAWAAKLDLAAAKDDANHAGETAKHLFASVAGDRLAVRQQFATKRVELFRVLRVL
jgi:hypothetical protein